MNPWPVAWSELRRSPWGAAAITLIVALAVALGIAVSAQERALRQGSARAADPFDILVGAPGSQSQLVLTGIYLQPAALPLMDGDSFATVMKRNGIAWAAPLAFGDSLRGQPVIGTTEAFVTLGGRRKPAEGRLFAKDDEAVVGADVTLAVGDRFTPTHGHSTSDPRPRPFEVAHDGHTVTVVGRLPRTGSPFDRAILVPIEGVWETHGLPTGHPEGSDRLGPPWSETAGGIPLIVVKAASVADAYRLRSQLRSPTSMAFFPAEVLVELYATMGDVRQVVSAMAVATQAMVYLAILIAVLAVTGSRRREVAVLRALGAPRAYVAAALWLGLAALILAGTLLGLGLGFAAATAASSVLAVKLGFALPVTLGGAEIAAAALAALVGLVLALLPALVLYRQPVGAALKGG